MSTRGTKDQRKAARKARKRAERRAAVAAYADGSGGPGGTGDSGGIPDAPALVEHLAQHSAPLYAVPICRHRYRDLLAYLRGRGGEYVAIPFTGGCCPDGDFLVISTVSPCTDAACGTDHRIRGADAAGELRRFLRQQGQDGARQLQLSAGWAAMNSVSMPTAAAATTRPTCLLCGRSPFWGGIFIPRARSAKVQWYRLCRRCFRRPDRIAVVERQLLGPERN